MKVNKHNLSMCICLLIGILSSMWNTSALAEIQNKTQGETPSSVIVDEPNKNEPTIKPVPGLMTMITGKQEEQKVNFYQATVHYLTAATEPLKRGSLEEAQPLLEAACAVTDRIPQEKRKELAELISKIATDTGELRYNLSSEQQDYLIQYLLTTVEKMPGSTIEDRASLIEAQASVLIDSGEEQKAQTILLKLLRELEHSFPESPQISCCLKLLAMAYKVNGQLTEASKWQNKVRIFDSKHPSKASKPNLALYTNRDRSQLTIFSQWNGQNCDPEFPDYIVSHCSTGATSPFLSYQRPLRGEALKAHNLNALKLAHESGDVNAIIAALLRLRTRKLNDSSYTDKERIAFSQELEDIRAKQKNPYKLAWSKLNTANEYFMANENAKAFEKWKEALELSKTLPINGTSSDDSLLRKFTDLGYDFMANGALDTARTIFSETFKLSLEAPTPYKRAIALANLDLICQRYWEAKDYNTCQAILKDALNKAQERGSSGKVAARELQLRLANLYAKMKEPERANLAVNDFILADESTIDIGKRALIAGLTEHAKVLRENGYAKSATKLLTLAKKEQPRESRNKQNYNKQDSHPADSINHLQQNAPVNKNQQPLFLVP